MAQTLVNIAGTETFSDVWNDGGGGQASHSGGDIVFGGEGAIFSKTDVGSGDVWMRFQIGAVQLGENTGVAIGDSSGNATILIMTESVGDLHISYQSAYTTYTTWDTDASINNIIFGTYSNAVAYGVTIDISTKTVYVWADVTNSAPDSLTSWDSGAANDSGTFSYTAYTGRIGLGSFSSNPNSEAYAYFVGGNFESAGGIAIPIVQYYSNRRS